MSTWLCFPRCIFYVIFGDYNSKWLSDDDVATLTNWRNYAIFFVLPRLLQRFFFNLLSNKIKELRVNQVQLRLTLNVTESGRSREPADITVFSAICLLNATPP